MGAFGSNTMAFTEWSQFVLIPRVQFIIANKDAFLTQSHIAGFAYREYDGQEEIYGHLCQLLSEFDALFN